MEAGKKPTEEESKIMKDILELEQDCEKLLSFLKHPEPGLYTWSQAVYEQKRKMAKHFKDL